MMMVVCFCMILLAYIGVRCGFFLVPIVWVKRFEYAVDMQIITEAYDGGG